MTTCNDFEKDLRGELNSVGRRDTFDMSDTPEIGRADCHPGLQNLLRFLQSSVESDWFAADANAIRYQKRHRLLAKVAIIAGTGSILLAIAQLASVEVSSFETITFVAAVLAAATGLMAETDRHWLAYRHRAELLRMLKFRAVGKAFCENYESLHAWVAPELRDIPAVDDFARLREWAQEGSVAPPPLLPVRFNTRSERSRDPQWLRSDRVDLHRACSYPPRNRGRRPGAGWPHSSFREARVSSVLSATHS